MTLASFCSYSRPSVIKDFNVLIVLKLVYLQLTASVVLGQVFKKTSFSSYSNDYQPLDIVIGVLLDEAVQMRVKKAIEDTLTNIL